MYLYRVAFRRAHEDFALVIRLRGIKGVILWLAEHGYGLKEIHIVREDV